MKLLYLFPILVLSLTKTSAESKEWRIDFGRSEFAYTYGAATKYATRTTAAGWNNVSVATQTEKGAATLSSSYFAETVSKDNASVSATYAQQNANTVTIYDSENNADSHLSLSISKDSSIGTFDTIKSSKAPTDALFNDTPRPDWIPTNAYGDFIYTYLNDNNSGAFTLTISGFKAGLYNLTIIAGGNSYMGSVYEGNDATATYTLNDESTYTITGTNAAGGGYAGVLEWQEVEIDAEGLLTLKVEGGYLGEENGIQKYTAAAINTMVITMVPEPASSTLGLILMCGFAARRRR
ncbi:MAG: PEP-CTERM sorting domain-containing protein [Akkermansia sp.]|nr:PEP-CTERM sorting domain-containing protein [Akkermansia sp.]